MIAFNKYYNKFNILSVSLVVISLLFLIFKGLNFGIDFKGGTLIELRSNDTKINVSSLRDNLNQMDLGDVSVKNFGNDTDFLIKFENNENKKIIEEIKINLDKSFGNNFNFRRVENVGPKVSKELLRSGVIAISVALILMLIYIWIRFEWQFSLGAIAALFHDVIVTLGLFSLLGLEINLSIIAAVLTIVGYSMNDTVVIFDRVRENLRKYKKLELVNSGLNNIWGFQLRGNGQWYGTEANDLGYSIVPMEVGTGFPGIGNDRLRPYQPWVPELHNFRVGGTGISGVAFADDETGSFPEAWRDVAFLANPITSTINSVKIIRNPDGSISAKHLPDLLTSKDDWFRPVNLEFGPDGCLYIADWYNKIISHNELPTTHPDRDKSHGRIFRICHKSQKPRTIENFYEIKTKDLVNYLKSPSLWAKRAAWHQISDRPIEETKKLSNELLALASDKSQTEITRILALWSLEGIRHYDKNLINSLLAVFT